MDQEKCVDGVTWYSGLTIHVDTDPSNNYYEYVWDLPEGMSIANYTVEAEGGVSVITHAQQDNRVTFWIAPLQQGERGTVRVSIETDSVPPYKQGRTVTFVGRTM